MVGKRYNAATIGTSSLQRLVDEYLADCRARGLSRTTLENACGFPLLRILPPLVRGPRIAEPGQLDVRC